MDTQKVEKKKEKETIYLPHQYSVMHAAQLQAPLNQPEALSTISMFDLPTYRFCVCGYACVT